MDTLFVALIVLVAILAVNVSGESKAEAVRIKIHRDLKVQQARLAEQKDKPSTNTGDGNSKRTLRDHLSPSGGDDRVDLIESFHISPGNLKMYYSSSAPQGGYRSPMHRVTYFTTDANHFLVIVPYTVQLADNQDYVYFTRQYSDTSGAPSDVGYDVGEYNGVNGPTNGSLPFSVNVSTQWNSLRAVFFAESDNSQNRYLGFDFDIVSVPANLSRPSTASPWPSSTTQAPFNNTDCPGDIYIYSDGSAYFDSPNYGNGDYPNNADCLTWISTNAGQQLVFHRHHVDLEDIYDILFLYDGSTNRQLARITFSGNDLSWPILSDSNSVYAIFVTDSSVTRSGFRLLVESVPFGQYTTQRPSTGSPWNPTQSSYATYRPSTGSPWNPTQSSYATNGPSTSSPWNSTQRPSITTSRSTGSQWNTTQRPTVAPITWETGPNTTTTTYTQANGNSISILVQTVSVTGSSVVMTDTFTNTYSYSYAEWSKLKKNENGVYRH